MITGPTDLSSGSLLAVRAVNVGFELEFIWPDGHGTAISIT